MRSSVWKVVSVCAVLVLAAGITGAVGCGGDGGYNGPAEPLLVAAAVTVDENGQALVIVSTANSLSPVTMVNDGEVTVNGIPIPTYEQGYMYMGPLPLNEGDDVTVTVRRGVVIQATLPWPGRPQITEPAASSVHDAAGAITVAWTAPSVLPQQYDISVGEEFCASIMGFSEQVEPPATSLDIPADTLLAATSGITVHVNAQNRTEVFDGETLTGSYFLVVNGAESAPFSTQ